MSHHIYTTPGFITHSAPHGEAGKFLLIFTRDLGMIGATAQGVRHIRSKLRYHTQDFSYGLFSVVKGKEVWRVTGAKEVGSRKEKGKGRDANVKEISDSKNRKLFARILSLLKRLLHGEEKDEKLFEVVSESRAFLIESQDDEARELIECLTVLRILDCLGYIRQKNEFSQFLVSPSFDNSVLEKARKFKGLIIKEINEALKESQL